MQLVNDIRQANAVTHDSVFHADEVFATAILDRVFPDLMVYRTSALPANLPKKTIVYDVGGGKYDHHQLGGNGQRKNGVPYASAGLIWRDFGRALCQQTDNPNLVWSYVDRSLIQGIDAHDNGISPKMPYVAQPMTIPGVISGFHPVWDAATPDTEDIAFEKAVAFAGVILENTIEYGASKVRAKMTVQQICDQTPGQVIVLDCYMPWAEFVSRQKGDNRPPIYLAVYPNRRNHYVWCCSPNSPYKAPENWRGLVGQELQKVTGVKTATFVHVTGFMGGAETKQDAIEMAEKLISFENSKRCPG